MRLPPWRFTSAVLVRSVVIWAPIRILASAVNAMVPREPTDPSPLVLSPSTIVAVVAVTTGLTWLDWARRNEILFLTNLGVSRRALILLAGLLPLLCSITVAVLVRQ